MNLENKYKNIIDNLHDGLYSVDRDKVITHWNKTAEHISGFKAEEVVGGSCSENILTHIDCDGEYLCHGNCPLAVSIYDGIPQYADKVLRKQQIPVTYGTATQLGKLIHKISAEPINTWNENDRIRRKLSECYHGE